MQINRIISHATLNFEVLYNIYILFIGSTCLSSNSPVQ